MIEISLCILAKNEASSIRDCIIPIKPFVNEVLVFNDGSTDDTGSIATLSGATVINLPFSVADKGFAEAANFMVARARCEWILIVDADEILANPEHLQVLTRYPEREVWALPRRKWFQYPRVRMELERYPDWQVRFFKKGTGIFTGEMHVTYRCPKIWYSYRGPHIEHLQAENRSLNKIAQRAELYPKLAKIQGVRVYGGDVVKVVE